MTLLNWLREKPFTLSLSSGYFGFFAHAGVVKALEEHGLLPQKFTGSSAGALVGACVATGLKSVDLKNILVSLKREHFWDPGLGLGLLRGKRFRALLVEVLAHHDFGACRVPIAISTFDLFKRQTTVFTSGSLPQAVHASCALPGLFHPVWIDGRLYSDGGIADRPGLLGAAHNERILYHHLLSRRLKHGSKPQHSYLPQRPELCSLVFSDLPAVGPFKLHEGLRAFEHAYEQTCAALAEPVGKFCPAHSRSL